MALRKPRFVLIPAPRPRIARSFREDAARPSPAVSPIVLPHHFAVEHLAMRALPMVRPQIPTTPMPFRMCSFPIHRTKPTPSSTRPWKKAPRMSSRKIALRPLPMLLPPMPPPTPPPMRKSSIRYPLALSKAMKTPKDALVACVLIPPRARA